MATDPTAAERADARWQTVTCRDCKDTYQCTPENDYYDNATLDDGQCTRCLIRSTGMNPETTPVLVIDPRTMTEADPRDLALRPEFAAGNDATEGDPVTETSEPAVSVTLELSQRVAGLLTVLTAGEHGPDGLEGVLLELADHAQQGVCRPGSWERGWLEEAFGDEWESALEPDTGNVAGDGRVIFQRPIRPCPNVPPCGHPLSAHAGDGDARYCLTCLCGDDEDDPDE